MKHQPRDLKPNLASRSEVLSIYKCPPQKIIIGDLSPKFEAQNIKFWTTFPRLLHKNASVNLQCVPLQVDLLS